MEMCMDEMLNKSKIDTNHIKDLSQMFNQLKKHQMKLNLTKCAFGV